MHPRIAKLTRTLRHLPHNKPAVYLLTQGLRSTGELHLIAVLMECWMSVCQSTRPDLTLLTLYWRQSLERTRCSARWLVLTLVRRASFDRLFVPVKASDPHASACGRISS